MAASKLIFGVGINDATYKVKGGGVTCPYYRKWSSMLERCYSERELREYPQYRGCLVETNWHYFSNFKSWMESQDWEGKHLDKDLLGDGKLYSPETCCFLKAGTNMFLTNRKNGRGAYLLGVHLHKGSGKFRAVCNNPSTKKQEHLGLFIGEMEAHLAWKAKKHEHSCKLAEAEADSRVVVALLTKYK
jgi:hypothetical protein